MSEQSTWLRYVPPILWDGEDPAAPFSLGTMLCIFEKLLTGIDDGVVIRHRDHVHRSLDETIGQLHRLYDPWATPPAFLDWLASWVSFEFPILWDEYARRGAIGRVVEAHRYRGLKQGLYRLLELMALNRSRPRIAIDDGSRVLAMRPEAGREVPLQTVVSQGPSVRLDAAMNRLLNFEGITRPSCIAVAPDGSLIVGDIGTPTGWTPIVEQRVWRLLPDDRPEFTGVPPVPLPIGPPGTAWNLISPVAVAVDISSPWNVYVLDQVVFPSAPALYRLTSPSLATVTTVATAATLQLVWPVAMTFDPSGHLLILDRGSPAPAAGPASPKIVDVQLAPLVVTATALPAGTVTEPLALTVLPGGDLIVADGGDQPTVTPGNLVRVNRNNAAAWVATPLLSLSVGPDNPLVHPTGLALADDDVLYVLDTGLKAYLPQLDPALSANPYLRQIAEMPAVYRVDLSTVPPVVSRASDSSQMVNPTDLAVQGESLVICDRGEIADLTAAGPQLRVWRSTPHEFGVVVHFAASRSPTTQGRGQVIQAIQEIVNAGAPAHTAWTMVYGV